MCHNVCCSPGFETTHTTKTWNSVKVSRSDEETQKAEIQNCRQQRCLVVIELLIMKCTLTLGLTRRLSNAGAGASAGAGA